MRIYLDLLMLLNFTVDYLLLAGTNRLAGFPPDGLRTAAAAALGSLYSGACLLPGFRFLGNALWRTVCLCLMAVMAFGWNRSSVRRTGVFVLLSMAMGGMATAMEKRGLSVLLFCGATLWLLCRVAFGGKIRQQEYVPLEIRYGDSQISLLALRDTGNTLRDPVTGQPVLVISADAARKITGLTEAQLQDPLGTVVQHPLPGLRLIPYRAVGQPGGMLLAMVFDDVKIGSRRQKATVAFDAGGLGRGEIHQALTGGSI